MTTRPGVSAMCGADYDLQQARYDLQTADLRGSRPAIPHGNTARGVDGVYRGIIQWIRIRITCLTRR